MKFICKSFEHDNSALKYVTELVCQNPMSESGRNRHHTVSDEDIGNVCILREMFEVREGRAICDIFNIGHVDFIINDLCVN